MPADFDALRRVQLHEKNHAALSPIDADFYASCKSAMEDLEKQACEGIIDADRERSNMARLLREVISTRQQKILVKAQRDLRTGEVSSDGLALEEKQLYVSLIKLLEAHESTILPRESMAALSAPEAKADGAQDGLVSLRVVQDVMQFVGRDLKVHGPFKANETVKLEKDDAALLLKHGLAQECGQIYA
ncbi:MAG: hypothetical protein WC792_05025 [Candidatus Micrarchaeia archaeon]|jgi:DNA replication initiation complex subunit (GINS family)